ncbi:MAG TPA: AbrB/MazE/SpoVT family DNA-binding domain-containing protein [Longimicrobium sp.]
MIEEVIVRQNGGALEVTLPKAMTDRLNLRPGDKVYTVETEHGILLTPFDPETARVMESEARISSRYADALAKLAKLAK